MDEADNQGGQEETGSNRRNKDDQHRNKRKDRYKDRRLKKEREGGGGGWESTLGRRKPQWKGFGGTWPADGRGEILIGTYFAAC